MEKNLCPRPVSITYIYVCRDATIHALFTIPAASAKHLYPSLASFVAYATNFFVFLLSLLIMQRSISWNQVNKTLSKYHFKREENYRNSINSRSRPKSLPSVETLF